MNATVPAPPAARSPSYPNAPLGEAISQVAKIEQLYRQSQVDREVAAKLIGYSGLSGPASKALAALASYGLVERAGKGEMRVTSRARAILYPDNLEERRQNLVAAAFEPKLFQELRARFPDMIPPEDGIITYLHRQGFVQSAIRPAMKAYRDTLLFLQQEGATDSHGKEHPEGADLSLSEGNNDDAFGKARVGDLVEVEIAGALVTPEPVRVRGVTEDQGTTWVFVDGSETGIDMENIKVLERPEEVKAPPTLPLGKPPADEGTASKLRVNDLKPLFDFESVTINTKITSQWHLSELISRLEKLMPMLPEGVKDQDGESD